MSSSRLRFFESSVGTKVLIGVTGLFLVLYLIIHIAGNTVFLFGPNAFNAYADTLGDLTLGALGAVLAAVVVHALRRRGRLAEEPMPWSAGVSGAR